MSDGARREAPHLAAKPGSADDLLNVRALSYSNPPVKAPRRGRSGQLRVLEFVNYGTSPAPELFN